MSLFKSLSSIRASLSASLINRFSVLRAHSSTLSGDKSSGQYIATTTTNNDGVIEYYDEDGFLSTVSPTEIPPREFYGCMRQVKTSPQKLNLVAKLIRRMKVGEALIQLEFCEKKAARFVKMALQDTQRRAIENYQADPLKLYVAESFVGKGTYLKRIRYHGRGMHGLMHKYYAHYFLKLKEGTPPVRPRWSKEQSRRYKTRRLIQRGPLNVPNSL